MNRYFYVLNAVESKVRRDYAEVISWVTANNKPKDPKTYHNTDHLIKSAVLVHLLAINSVSKTAWEKDVDRFIYEMTMTMLVHDFNYLGSKDDQENIDHSIQSLEQLGFFDKFIEKERLVELVQLTHYSFDNPTPARPKDPRLCEAFQVLRDADQLYGTVYFDRKVMDGLYNDIGIRFGFSEEDFIRRNIDYIKKGRMLSHFGRVLHHRFLQEALYDHQLLLDNLTKDKMRIVPGAVTVKEFSLPLSAHYNDFIHHYMMFYLLIDQPSSKDGLLSEVAKNINNGDCGLAAIAMYLLYTDMGERVKLMENGDHAIISMHGLYYDTENINGSIDYPKRFSDKEYKEYTLAEMAERFMPCDALGGYLLLSWCQRTKIKFPTELQHCIDNAETYDPQMKGLYVEAARQIADMYS